MKKLLVTLEDNGQDFLEFVIENEKIIKARPFQNEIWKGATTSELELEEGKEFPIHKPPHINFGFLKHKVKNIKQIE
jgi:hypothetical protein